MLNKSGNLIEEGIPITKDLLDFAKANNYKISLKTGEYQKEPIPTTRGQRYNKDLISIVHNLYHSGNLYLTDYFEVFGFSKLEGLMQAIKQCGFKLLSRKETQELYGEQILQRTEATNMGSYGCKAPTQNPAVVELGRQTCLRKFKVDNYFKSAEFQVQKRKTMLRKYKVEHSMQNPESRAKAMATWKANFKLEEDGVWITSIPAVRDSINSSLLESCGAESFVQSEKFRDIMDQKDPRFSKIREFKDDPCADPAEIIDYVTGNYSPSQARVYLKELGIKQPTNYLTEVKLCNFLESIGIEYIHNAKKDHQVRKHNGEYYELDVYIPALKLGIEINGLAFHSANFSRYGEPKTKDYHFEKFKAFHSSGILVLSFTDYEQDFFTEDYINIIKHHLTGEPLNVSKEFLEFNQISNIEESLNYGLFDASRFTGNFEDHQHQRFIKKFEYWDCGVIRQLNVDSY
jgi:hypothetical protein